MRRADEHLLVYVLVRHDLRRFIAAAGQEQLLYAIGLGLIAAPGEGVLVEVGVLGTEAASIEGNIAFGLLDGAGHIVVTATATLLNPTLNAVWTSGETRVLKHLLRRVIRNTEEGHHKLWGGAGRAASPPAHSSRAEPFRTRS